MYKGTLMIFGKFGFRCLAHTRPGDDGVLLQVLKGSNPEPDPDPSPSTLARDNVTTTQRPDRDTTTKPDPICPGVEGRPTSPEPILRMSRGVDTWFLVSRLPDLAATSLDLVCP